MTNSGICKYFGLILLFFSSNFLLE